MKKPKTKRTRKPRADSHQRLVRRRSEQCNFRIEPDLAEAARFRAERMGLSFNQYVSAIMHIDVARGGPLTIHERPIKLVASPSKKNCKLPFARRPLRLEASNTKPSDLRD